MEKVLYLTGFLVLLFCANAQRFNSYQPQPPVSRNNYQNPQLQQFGSNKNYNSFNSQTSTTTKAPSSSICKEKNARYPVSGQCDSYIECRDGVPEEKLCPDGLLYNVNASVFNYPCSYPIDVDCAGRSGLQRSEPTEECPHQYGYFRHSQDPAECGKFTNCVGGRPYTIECPEGLAFSRDTYRCDWPDMVPDCDAERFLGFTCPQEYVDPFFGQLVDFKFYKSPTDCQRYYMCINGKPRLFNCGDGNGYNEFINGCDSIENVTGCSPEVYQRVAAAKAQREQNLIEERALINQRSRF